MSMGTGAGARFEAIREITGRMPRRADIPQDGNGRPLKVSEFFGQNTFDIHQMREVLPRTVYSKLISTIEAGKKLDIEIADTVAQSVKDWAMAKGVTHFCHWFQPMTGATAEKHDSFITFDEHKRPIEKFSAGQLIQSEPDASSFPSGGMRTTFEARGYTAWDPTSPIFIMEHLNGKTLCIPSVFISYHGDALDEKTGLIRSMDALSDAACKLLRLIGDDKVQRVVPTLGPEQEYFLIDRAYYNLRPDLIMARRTLVGGQPPKGQQLEDHYFGSIPARVQAFMSEMEAELYKLGIPVKTRHNEVAPSQFETAPIFEEANVATDHNHLVMETLRKVARRHQFETLLHEKPYAGINGTGKHCNWSMAVSASGPELDGMNLLDPGKNPHQNLRFLLFCVATLKGVHKHSGLLRAAIASSGNDHRLGANEAPPAIISAFLGNLLTKVLDRIEDGSALGGDTAEAVIKLGVSKLPEVAKDNTDRNRTSPFAFTGNKFEFRAVGGGASIALPVTLLNAAVADGIHDLTEALQKKLKSSKSTDGAILDVLAEMIRETKAIRFEGNNYSEEWVREAEKRGLPNLRKTPEALKKLVAEPHKSMLTRLNVFTEAEIKARYHVRLERYIKDLIVEIDTLRHMVDTQILPSCFAYYGELAVAAKAAKDVGAQVPQTDAMTRMSTLLSGLQAKRAKLETAFNKLESLKDEEEKAEYLAREVTVAMDDVRSQCDQLEGIVSDDFWPLPKYREILFLSMS